jgi:hypothetical protein
MKIWLKNGLIYTFLLLLLSLTAGCGVDDAQKTVATFYSSVFAKADKPTAEERMNKVESIVSKRFSGSSVLIGMVIAGAKKEGITRPYYLADNPTKPQTDTRRYITVKFLQADAPKLFNGSDTYYYETMTVEKEGNEWKITGADRERSSKMETIEMNWIEIKPTDYLDY